MRVIPSRAGLLLLALGLLPALLAAQPLDLTTPADSPLWWTLTDELSPQKLRQIYLDEVGHYQRYLEALEAGLTTPLPVELEGALSFYHNTQQTPELTSMWEAFSVFAEAYVAGPMGRDVSEELTLRGVSPEGIGHILAIARRNLAEEQLLIEQVRDHQLEFMKLKEQLLEDLGDSPESRRRIRSALERRSYALFVQHSGYSEQQIATLEAAWRTNPPAECAARSLAALREQLGDEDWQGLRRYLLEVVVAAMGPAVDFDFAKEVGR